VSDNLFIDYKCQLFSGFMTSPQYALKTKRSVIFHYAHFLSKIVKRLRDLLMFYIAQLSKKMTRSRRSCAEILVVFQAAATPISLCFTESNDKTSTNPKAQTDVCDSDASPLWIHVHHPALYVSPLFSNLQ